MHVENFNGKVPGKPKKRLNLGFAKTNLSQRGFVERIFDDLAQNYGRLEQTDLWIVDT